jgi:acyl-CoA synthetase (AMP-forming)/AMP-acid ligase II
LWRDKERIGDRTALQCGETGRGLTYEGLRHVTRNLGGWLHRYHGRGNVLTLFLPNSVELALCSLAAFEAGVVVSTVDPEYTKEELAGLLQGGEAACVVTTSMQIHTVLEASRLAMAQTGRDIPLTIVAIDDKMRFNGVVYLDDLARCEPAEPCEAVSYEETALLLHSYDRSGRPLPVRVSHQNLVATCEQLSAGEVCPIGDTSVVAALPPMFQYYGLASVLLHGLNRGAHLLTLATFEPQPWLAAIRERRVTVLPTIPSVLTYLASDRVAEEDLSSVDTVIVGDAGVPPGQLGRLLEVLPPRAEIVRVYGPSGGPTVFHQARGCKKSESLGQLLPDTEAKVVDADSGKELPPRAEGEICVRGPQLPSDYPHSDPQSGWLHTGDTGYYDKDGFFYLTGTTEECLSVDGFVVCPAEMEGVLKEHPGVRDAAVIPVEGLSPIGAIVPLDPAQPPPEKEILNFLASRLAPYKRLSALYYLPHIPRLPDGTLDKDHLRLERYNKEFVALTAV